ncbi:MAG: type II secretion system major pseudopilin GspG [Planctomycetia bacterium]
MNTLPQHRNNRRGFTLAEMMVVIVIIGLLGTLVVPNVLKRFSQASRTKAKADITEMMSALDEFAINNAGKYPDSLEVLVTPDENGHTYLKGPAGKLPKDPWKNEYVYEPPQSGQPVPRILSYGKDGQPGGEGDDRDIASDDSEG